MKNISIIELKEEELENINAAGARSFFKKVGKGIGKGLTEAGKFVKYNAESMKEMYEMTIDYLR